MVLLTKPSRERWTSKCRSAHPARPVPAVPPDLKALAVPPDPRVNPVLSAHVVLKAPLAPLARPDPRVNVALPDPRVKPVPLVLLDPKAKLAPLVLPDPRVNVV